MGGWCCSGLVGTIDADCTTSEEGVCVCEVRLVHLFIVCSRFGAVSSSLVLSLLWICYASVVSRTPSTLRRFVTGRLCRVVHGGDR